MTSEAAGHSRHPPNPLARAKGGNVQPCHSERSVRSEESKAERQRFLATLGMTGVCFGMTLEATSFLRYPPVIPASPPVIPASTPRHSCEGRNPQGEGGGVRPYV